MTSITFSKRKNHRSYRFKLRQEKKRPTSWPKPTDFSQIRRRPVDLVRLEQRLVDPKSKHHGYVEINGKWYWQYVPGQCSCQRKSWISNGVKITSGCHSAPNEKGEIWIKCRLCGHKRFAVWKKDVPIGTRYAGHVANHWSWWLLHEDPAQHDLCGAQREILYHVTKGGRA